MNWIGVEGACALSEALKVNTTLTKLNLWGAPQHFKVNHGHRTNTNDKADHGIGVKGVRALSEALKVNTSLVSVEMPR